MSGSDGSKRPRRRPEHDILFTPIRVGSKVLRNRFYQVPFGPGWGRADLSTYAYFRAMRAAGGWAVVSTGTCPIRPDSDISPWRSELLWDDSDGAMLGFMVELVHEEGALAAIELSYASAANSLTRAWTLGPSARSMHYLGIPWHVKAATREEIRSLQHAWVAAARRAASLGFDIVYVYGSHGSVLGQFLSAESNTRTDEYGGSLENRARFWLETLAMVRNAVSPACALAVRIAPDSAGTSAAGFEDFLGFVELADDLVDLWDVNKSADWSMDSATSRFQRQGFDREILRSVRERASKPIVTVGRFTEPDVMAAIVREGVIDLIGAARPAIADPFLPRKIEEGRYDEIRECVGANICIARTAIHLGCVQNATAGEEFRRGWHPEVLPRIKEGVGDVLVVGGGPAGMECAIVLARRGAARVHLVERSDALGGHLRWVTELPSLAEWKRIVGWRTTQIARSRAIEVILNEELTARDILEYGANTVILATGSFWADTVTDPVTGQPVAGADASLPHVLTPEQIMIEGKRPPGSRVIVYDAEGYFVAVGLAELLAGEGYEVELATPLPRVAPYLDLSLESDRVRSHLASLRIAFAAEQTLETVEPSKVTLRTAYHGSTSRESDAVVIVSQRISRNSLLAELLERSDLLGEAEISGVYTIGDATTPRLLEDAIFDGHRMGREIDGPNPALPLPFRRNEVQPARVEQWGDTATTGAPARMAKPTLE